jgi:mono/diheme cytochrome c family protein
VHVPILMMRAAACCLMILMSGCTRGKANIVTPELLKQGQVLFSRNCAGCHPNGENRVYPQKSLHRMELRANGITTPAGIVAVMRHPGQGMKQFDRKSIPDPDAFAIAHYIFATF